MSAHKETFVDTPLGKVRVWAKGKGRKLGFFAGIGGLPRWTPFLDALAEHRRVIAPSLAGFPGGASSESIDDQLDRIVAAHDVFTAAGLAGADLVGASVGGALAAEIAALWPKEVRRLALIAPFGLFDESDPVADIFAQRPGAASAVLSQRPGELNAFLAAPEGADAADWEITTLRANVSAASLIWPLGETGLRKRLGRVRAQTLLVWGENDRIVPPTYARHFSKAIAGKARIRKIRNAGHMAEFDQPKAVAKAVVDFCSQ